MEKTFDVEIVTPDRVFYKGTADLLEFKAELTISEGRFHQVKRMFASVGCKVTYLKRISMGTLTLGTLEKATYRKLTEQELASLKKEAENKQSSGV